MHAPGLEGLRPEGWKVGAAVAALGLNGLLALLLSLPAARRPPAPASLPILLVELEPWPASLLRRRPATGALARPSPAARAAPAAAPSEIRAPPAPVSVPTPVAPAQPTDAEVRRQAMARALGGSLLGCAAETDPSPEARQACLDRRAAMAESAASIAGSGDAARDAVFARHAARRLAAWEKRRERPPPGDPPCEAPHPVAGCEGVNIQVDLFSTRDGFLPNLRKRRE